MYTVHILTRSVFYLTLFWSGFQGVISELHVVGDPRAAERHCEEDEDDSDLVSVSTNDLFLRHFHE